MAEGVHELTFNDLAAMRGAKLVGVENTDDVRLFAISRGRKSTPGHGLSLDEATLRADTLRISVIAAEPEQGAMLPQVITNPCLVVSVDRQAFEQATINRLLVVDQQRRELASMTFE